MELDEQARRVRRLAREYAPRLRAVALAVDADPAGCEHLPALPDDAHLRPRRCVDSAVAALELAVGDAGALLALPGGALAGAVVAQLGSDRQRAEFAEAIGDGRTWTFCAITEPGAGSDAGAMTATLTPNPAGGYWLDGVKRYIAGGTRGRIGVVFARLGASPLAIRAVIVHSGLPGLVATPLDTLGLRGFQLSEISCARVPVAEHQLLAAHLSPVRRGMWGAARAFNAVRTQVAALAVGTAIGIHEYVRSRSTLSDELDAVAAQLSWARHLTYQAAAAVDADAGNAHLPALAKAEAVRLVRRVAVRLPRLLGPAARLDHPLLEKWWRDAHGFEFMEGTTTMQRLAVAQGFLTGRFDPGRPA